ncbi:UNVERIFIED_CONTAM: hypothetical protein Sradi_0551900 [Sesamum radiatum]|uniref:SWIM-type domain-containing protein n=1 Tax=Sesamum radiatum TaxID=300843 RepID=A0AAW2VHR3_SESRA
MVMIRAEKHNNMPPPAYHPESQSITVTMLYGGVASNWPVAQWLGGNVKKFDYVNATHMNKSNLDLIAEKCGISGEGGIKIYIEHKPPAPEEVAVECDGVVGTDDVGLDASENVETGVGDVGAHYVDQGITDDRWFEEGVSGRVQAYHRVVQKETRDTWEWFLTILKQDLNIVRDDEFTFMSDKQKGLIQAFQNVFPNSAHRSCVRHLHNNFKTAGYRGLAFKNILWKAARASTVGEFKMRMEEMKKLDQGAFDWFNDKPPQEWSKSHFNEIPKCDMLLNNCCESFNANIMDARDKPILTMLEWIREYLMKRLQENRDRASKKWKGTLCPKIKKLLQKQIDKIGDCIPIKANDRHYQISCYDGGQFSVDLDKRSCTCRLWQLSGVPCKHACSAIFNQGLMPEDMVHAYYNVETYKLVYEPAILPISGEMLWSETSFIPPLPPNFGRGPGRPAGARNREPDEPNVNTRNKGAKKPIKIKRQSTKHHCKICGEEGHNAKGCALWKDFQEPGLDQIQVDALFFSEFRDSGVTGQQPILPPVLEQNEAIQVDDAPETMTDLGPSILTQQPSVQGPILTQQPSVQGPSMYEQLQMAHNNIQVGPQVTL